MRTKSVTRANLIQAVCQSVGLPYIEAATLVQQVLKEITDCLERGEDVKLATFGTFLVRKRGPRPGRNPKTGEPVLITPRRVIVFKPSGKLIRRRAEAKQQGRKAASPAAAESEAHQ